MANSARWQALRELFERHGQVLKQAWSERAHLEAPSRLPHEAQFLPAALELQETPVSPLPRVIMWVLIVFAAVAVAWATLGHMDVVAIAAGKIVPNDRTKVIQPFETATVKAIRVRDGQSVSAGEVLIELDATYSRAEAARVANDLLTARLQAARAQALLAAMASGKTPVLPVLEGVQHERHVQEQRVLASQHGEYQANLTRIDTDIDKRQAELRSTRGSVRKLEHTAPMARQRAEDFKDLVEKNFISKHGYLEKEQARIEQEADLATQRARLEELTVAVRQSMSERAALMAETKRLVMDSLNEFERLSASHAQELIKADSRERLMTLTAPVAGTVQQLAVHTVGGVVTPAQALMIIVPKDNPIEVEAYIENKDIGFVNAGQEAVVKIETFPFTRYGTLDAKVTQVSSDAVNDDKRGLVFTARVALERATIQVEDKLVKLSPGMAVSVEVKTGKRRVIEYFLSPLMQYKNESLRER